MSVPLTEVAGHRVLFVMAVALEYGPSLSARFQPLLTGVGPVEAGIAVSEALAVLKAQAQLPTLVVCLGSAGSAVLDHTGVYQASSVSYRDMDASALGFERGCTPLLDLPAEIALPCLIPGVPAARLSTGANVVSGATYSGIDADMVDMESFAVLRACQRHGIPLICLRGISDGRSELTGLHDWTSYLHVVDEKLAHAVHLLEQALETGALQGFQGQSAQ